ncbi:MAG TPA: hypothetical protein VGL02_09745, partial [Streptomyces sp.]
PAGDGLRIEVAVGSGAAELEGAVVDVEGTERLSVVLAHDGGNPLDGTPEANLARLAELAGRRGGLAEVRERELIWWVPLSKP